MDVTPTEAGWETSNNKSLESFLKYSIVPVKRSNKPNSRAISVDICVSHFNEGLAITVK
jgi:hypothetical protein